MSQKRSKRRKWVEVVLDTIFHILFKKEVERMVDLYCALIVAGKRTIDSVPKNMQVAVMELLTAIGLDGGGNVA